MSFPVTVITCNKSIGGKLEKDEMKKESCLSCTECNMNRLGRKSILLHN